MKLRNINLSENEETYSKNCTVCDFTLDYQYNFNYSPSSLNSLPEFLEAEINYCNNCGFSGISKEINEQRLNIYYSKYYNAKSLKEFRYGLPVKLRSCIHIFNPRYQAQLETIKHFKRLTKSTKYLEIGSGKGDLFNLLKHSGLGGKFFALEPDISAQSILSFYDVTQIKGNIFDKKILTSEKFDVIILSHTLEHFNPSKISLILKNIKNLLGERGIFLCEVPNADLKKYPNACENIVPHLSFFSKKSLEILMKKQGFKIIYSKTLGFSQTEKDNLSKVSKAISEGKLETTLIKSDNVLVNTNLNNSTTLSIRLKNFFVKLISTIFGIRFTAFLINKFKMVRLSHPLSYYEDDTDKVRDDGENIRLLVKL